MACNLRKVLVMSNAKAKNVKKSTHICRQPSRHVFEALFLKKIFRRMSLFEIMIRMGEKGGVGDFLQIKRK